MILQKSVLARESLKRELSNIRRILRNIMKYRPGILRDIVENIKFIAIKKWKNYEKFL